MLINTIPVLEAQASSEVENIVTTADRLFQLANAPDAKVDAASKEALRYGKALYSGFQSLSTRPLTMSGVGEESPNISLCAEQIAQNCRYDQEVSRVEASRPAVIRTASNQYLENIMYRVPKRRATNW